MALAEEAKRIAALFEYGREDVNKGVKEFIREMEEGLKKDGTELAQIPTYVTAVPTGQEEGTYLTADLGGTNFRVCAFDIKGNGKTNKYDLLENGEIRQKDGEDVPLQRKSKVPANLQAASTAKELFSYLANEIKLFMEDFYIPLENDDEETKKRKKNKNTAGVFKLGFTFSFPVQQTAIDKGTLLVWTKGFTIKEALGKDVCQLLQREIDSLNLPVKITIVALVNDTVGALMARSYESPGKTGALIGAIFGTGTNGAYVEKLSKVTKLINDTSKDGTYDKSTGDMVINTEWGSFDNSLRVLPNTKYDALLDDRSVNSGHQMFEKRVSGMFLGEILRLILRELITDPSSALFKEALFKEKPLDTELFATIDTPFNPEKEEDENDRPRLFQQWGLDSKLLSDSGDDETPDLSKIRDQLATVYRVTGVSVDEAAAVKVIAAGIGRRAARLAAVALAGVILSTDSLAPPKKDAEEDILDIGTDGSLVEHYPNFKGIVREAFREIEGIGEAGEKRIRIEHADDGSGVGAALIALKTTELAKK